MGLKESKLQDLTIQNLAKRTDFSTDEIKRWYGAFIRDSPTGEMQRSEFVRVYKEMFPNGDATEFSHYIFNVIDTDGSGSISFEEFLKALTITSHGSVQKKLEWAFALYDIDNSGTITKDEIQKVYNSIWSLVSGSEYFQNELTAQSINERVEKIFNIMDKDGNGEVTKEEWVEGAHHDKFIIETLSLYQRHHLPSRRGTRFADTESLMASA